MAAQKFLNVQLSASFYHFLCTCTTIMDLAQAKDTRTDLGGNYKHRTLWT